MNYSVSHNLYMTSSSIADSEPYVNHFWTVVKYDDNDEATSTFLITAMEYDEYGIPGCRMIICRDTKVSPIDFGPFLAHTITRILKNSDN